MCPKIHTEKKEYESPEEVQALKILISTGDSYFKIQSLKVGINRQPLFVCPVTHGIIRQDYLGQNEPYYMRLHDRVRKRGNCEDIVYYQLRTGNGSGDITGADKAGE